ncbi:ArsR family transcriptional regulator [Streptomyces sp. NPDC051985]|uniref:ArsR family transcriptional regulator n=1 Tax=Streptomyces sp. NPDC051985 TaxID=3155807 RepID=UPI00342FEDB4
MRPLPAGARERYARTSNHNARIRDIAARCGLTDRADQKIISVLEQDGHLSHTRSGRTNHYRIAPSKVLRHPAEAGLTLASAADAGRGPTPGNGRAGPSRVLNPACRPTAQLGSQP